MGQEGSRREASRRQQLCAASHSSQALPLLSKSLVAFLSQRDAYIEVPRFTTWAPKLSPLLLTGALSGFLFNIFKVLKHNSIIFFPLNLAIVFLMEPDWAVLLNAK